MPIIEHYTCSSWEGSWRYGINVKFLWLCGCFVIYQITVSLSLLVSICNVYYTRVYTHMCIVFSCLPLWHAPWWVDSSCAPGRWWQVHLPFLYTDMEAISVLTFAHSPLTSTSSDKVQAFLVSSFAHVRPKYIDRSILLLRTSQLNRTSEPSRKKKQQFFVPKW